MSGNVKDKPLSKAYDSYITSNVKFYKISKDLFNEVFEK